MGVKIYTPVEGFTGKVGSVDFVDGVGDLEDRTQLFYFVEQGYRIEDGDEPPKAKRAPAKKAAAKKAAPKKATPAKPDPDPAAGGDAGAGSDAGSGDSGTGDGGSE